MRPHLSSIFRRLQGAFSLAALVALSGLLGGCAQLMPTMTQGGVSPGGAPAPYASPTAGEPGGAAGEPGSAGPSEKKPEAKSGPTTVSVSIRSSCSKTVSVFYGDKPKYGSGTKSSVSSNSVSNKTFRPGDMMWVIDDKEEGLASATIGETTRELKIGSDCKSLEVK